VQHTPNTVLATGPNCRDGSGWGSNQNLTVTTGLTTWITRTVGNGTVLPPKPSHCKFTILAPIKYLSSDHTMTWSVCTLFSFIRSSTSRCPICDWTDIRWVAIENPQISLKFWCYFTAIQRILIKSQIWIWEVEEGMKLHNLRIHRVVIRWDLRHIFGAKLARTVKWSCNPGITRPKNCGFMSGPGNNPAKAKWVGFWTGSGTKQNQTKPLVKPRTTGGLPGPIANTNRVQHTLSAPYTEHSIYLGLSVIPSVSQVRVDLWM